MHNCPSVTILRAWWCLICSTEVFVNHASITACWCSTLINQWRLAERLPGSEEWPQRNLQRQSVHFNTPTSVKKGSRKGTISTLSTFQAMLPFGEEKSRWQVFTKPRWCDIGCAALELTPLNSVSMKTTRKAPLWSGHFERGNAGEV